MIFPPFQSLLLGSKDKHHFVKKYENAFRKAKASPLLVTPKTWRLEVLHDSGGAKDVSP